MSLSRCLLQSPADYHAQEFPKVNKGMYLSFVDYTPTQFHQNSIFENCDMYMFCWDGHDSCAQRRELLPMTIYSFLESYQWEDHT